MTLQGKKITNSSEDLFVIFYFFFFIQIYYDIICKTEYSAAW